MAKNDQYSNYKVVNKYVNNILKGKKIACNELIQACERYKKDLKNKKYEFNPKDAEFVIKIIEETFVHDQGEKIDGTPLQGQPFLLEDWQKFIIYNLLGFYIKNTIERRFKEAFIFIPRKNGKTRFVAGLAWALAMLGYRSGSKIYITSAALSQSLQSFEFINYNINEMGEKENFRILDNNQEHSIRRKFKNGSIYIRALAANPDRQDSLNCNVGIADEMHAYKTPKQYNIIKEAMKAYTNKLMIGITTAGDNMNSFCFNRLQYCKKILDETVENESYFIFITKADEGNKGHVDYTDPKIHEMANPNYGVSIRPEEILKTSMQAQEEPQQRKDFLAKELNIYTSAINAYFDIEEFKASDANYNWSLKELAKLPIKWYGGADLSKLHDLTATALCGTYKDVDIIITHGFFPVVMASKKADEDNIPLFGWQDDGHLTLCNTPTVEYSDVIKWFIKMKELGFKIQQVGFDKTFGREFFLGMRKAGFRIVEQRQLHIVKSEGFRRIEQKVKNEKLYYLHSQAFEYCVQNVMAVEKSDDAIQYEKVLPTQRIDLFDAGVFATIQNLLSMEKASDISSWIGSLPK